MRVAVASDHAGFGIKQAVMDAIREAGHEPLDCGTQDGTTRVDFPDFAEKAGQAVQNGEAERAVMICGSGVGVCITANKMKGIYASVCHDTYSAHQGVEHDNMNTLCLGGRIIGVELVKEIVPAFLAASYCGEDRFNRRINKIKSIEQNGKIE
ncbi:MAG: RpiB/LacA/LacB family sugar-phosphate isomerase [Chloroflexi bacterium]|jgi:ribose 5-phosphate isomerase B|nr:RpiB/LacA/LacB family sugar-phosphate isomerase [Anaerolineaceae bacterium]NMB87129.1 RpiB/LacA/LacB family sugar-phosphate isomerase [Chloroflexota bacterium]